MVGLWLLTTDEMEEGSEDDLEGEVNGEMEEFLPGPEMRKECEWNTDLRD